MLSTIALSDILLASAKEVFETMIFMDISDVSESDSKLEGETLLGSITFMNGVKGCLTICSDMDCAKTIALNMLGMEPDSAISKEEICDAIGEVTNMVMSRFLFPRSSSAGRWKTVLGNVQRKFMSNSASMTNILRNYRCCIRKVRINIE
jgi:hypothetical protein